MSDEDPIKCWCGGQAYFESFGAGSVRVFHCVDQPSHDPLDLRPTHPPRRLYIAGPMSGLPDCNFPAFYAAEKELQSAGYETMNPADNDTGASYREILKGDLRMLLQCDGVALLDGWWGSTGARLEAQIAGTLQMPVKSYIDWIDDWLHHRETEFEGAMK